MKVYIAGKITGNERYMEEFRAAEEDLEKTGCQVLNPAAVCSMLPEDLDYEEYMAVAFCLLEMADAVYFLESWKDSKGANREYGYAIGRGKKIIFERGEKSAKS